METFNIVFKNKYHKSVTCFLHTKLSSCSTILNWKVLIVRNFVHFEPDLFSKSNGSSCILHNLCNLLLFQTISTKILVHSFACKIQNDYIRNKLWSRYFVIGLALPAHQLNSAWVIKPYFQLTQPHASLPV